MSTEIARKRKYVIAVLSEGYIAGTEPNVPGNRHSFESRFKRLFEVKVRKFRPFSDAAEFEFRPIFVESADVGISTLQQTRTSAFGIVFNGNKDDCYFTVSDDALTKISRAAHSEGNVDYTVVLVNHADAVGCAIREKIALVTRTVSAGTVVHELGHTIGNLYDEYSSSATSGEKITSGNCSTEPIATNASWSHLFTGTVNVPTDPALGLAFGMYAGCARRADAYHPTTSCAMLDADDFYCKVCEDLVDMALKAAPPFGDAPADQYTYYRFIVRGSGKNATAKIADQWISAEEPRGGKQSVHGLWTLTVGERDVLGAMAVTGDPRHWRAYGPPDPDAPPDHYVPAPYLVVEIAVPHSHVRNLSPSPVLDPRLELFLYEGRREDDLLAIDTVPGGFAGANITARSTDLTNAITSLFQ